MTLDEMYQEIALYVDKPMVKTNGAYTGDEQKLARIFKTAINQAKNKIAEKIKPSYAEIITLDDSLMFDIENLSYTFKSLDRLIGANGAVITEWEWISTTQIKAPRYSANDEITVEYFYLPADLEDLGDELELPAGLFDHKLLCYFAAYFYLKIRNSDNQDTWLELWNDGFDNLTINRGNAPTRIIDVYGITDS